MRFSEAATQVWPPFVLVTGLLMIGLVVHRDGRFEQAGQALQGLPGSPVVLLVASLLLVTVVTAVLNLDTAVVFLTPVLLFAARGRGVDEEAFLYGAVYMANASSLYLPGSNLTNLLVLSHQPISGVTFAARMLPVALTATLATILGLLRDLSSWAACGHPPACPSDPRWSRWPWSARARWRPWGSRSRCATQRSPCSRSGSPAPRSRRFVVDWSCARSCGPSARSCSSGCLH